MDNYKMNFKDQKRQRIYKLKSNNDSEKNKLFERLKINYDFNEKSYNLKKIIKTFNEVVTREIIGEILSNKFSSSSFGLSEDEYLKLKTELIKDKYIMDFLSRTGFSKLEKEEFTLDEIINHYDNHNNRITTTYFQEGSIITYVVYKIASSFVKCALNKIVSKKVEELVNEAIKNEVEINSDLTTRNKIFEKTKIAKNIAIIIAAVLKLDFIELINKIVCE